MVLDHLGAFLWPSLIELRIIGRLAFPIFAYQLSVGYSMTSNKRKYFNRLIGVGFISQVPYHFLINDFRLNILFSLALGIFAIWALENSKYYYLLLIIPFSLFVDYQIYGLVIILIFYFLKNKIFQFLLFLLALILSSFYHSHVFYIFSLFSFIFIFNPLIEIKLPKRFFYIFYPTHLFLILIIKLIFYG